MEFNSDSGGAYAKTKYTGMTSADWQSGQLLAVAVSSSAIGNMGDDFFLEFAAYSDSEVYRYMTAGLTNEASPVLANNLFSTITFSNKSTIDNRMFVIKKGSFMTSIYKTGAGISTAVSTVSTNPGLPLKFKMCLIAGDLYDINNNLLIKTAYKLN